MNEEQIKEEIEQIGYQEFYRYYQEAGILIEQQKQELERLHSIIKEVREYIEYLDNVYIDDKKQDELLEILDKEKE